MNILESYEIWTLIRTLNTCNLNTTRSALQRAFNIDDLHIGGCIPDGEEKKPWWLACLGYSALAQESGVDKRLMGDYQQSASEVLAHRRLELYKTPEIRHHSSVYYRQFWKILLDLESIHKELVDG